MRRSRLGLSAPPFSTATAPASHGLSVGLELVFLPDDGALPTRTALTRRFLPSRRTPTRTLLHARACLTELPSRTHPMQTPAVVVDGEEKWRIHQETSRKARHFLLDPPFLRMCSLLALVARVPGPRSSHPSVARVPRTRWSPAFLAPVPHAPRSPAFVTRVPTRTLLHAHVHLTHSSTHTPTQTPTPPLKQ